MDIHTPKPWHGWREFLKEIGTIVIGVSIAIGAEQAMEALHHRAQVREMASKLRAESEENRHVIAFDVDSLKESLASADGVLAALARGEGAKGEGAKREAAPAGFQRADLFLPADTAWVSIRDSALLPIMPKLLVDNAWKVDATNEYVDIKIREISQVADQAEGALAVSRASPGDAEVLRAARLRLAELRVKESMLINTMAELQRASDTMLKGERLDLPTEVQKAQLRATN